VGCFNPQKSDPRKCMKSTQAKMKPEEKGRALHGKVREFEQLEDSSNAELTYTHKKIKGRRVLGSLSN